MQFISSLIVVEDVVKARLLYEGILGQKVLADHGENVAFEGGFSIHLRRHFEGLIGGRAVGKGGNGFELYFEEDELEPVQKELKARDFEFIHEIIEQPWRQRVMRFYDVDRNIVEIGESLEQTAFRLHSEHMPLDEISRTTSLTKEAIEKAIQKYGAIQPSSMQLE